MRGSLPLATPLWRITHIDIGQPIGAGPLSDCLNTLRSSEPLHHFGEFRSLEGAKLHRSTIVRPNWHRDSRETKTTRCAAESFRGAGYLDVYSLRRFSLISMGSSASKQNNVGKLERHC